EQGVAPGGAATVGVLAPRRGGEIAAVDRGAAGGVGDSETVAEQLCEELEIGRFAAAGAGAGEFEERLERLHFAHAGGVNLAAVGFGQPEEEIPVGALAVAEWRLRAHVDGFETGLGLVARGADVHANAAAGAILGGDLERVFESLPFGEAGVDGLETAGRGSKLRFLVNLAANAGMRTDEDTLAALDADA